MNDEFNTFLSNLYAERDGYSGGGLIDEVRDELKKYRLVKKLDLHHVMKSVCDYSNHVCFSSIKYRFCPHCGKPLSQTVL